MADSPEERRSHRFNETTQKLVLLEDWKRGSMKIPRKLYLSSTIRCNLRCKYCCHSMESFRNEHYENDLDEKTILRIIVEGVKMGIPEFSIGGGGEPFLRKQLVLDMMRAIRKGGANGAITTNATLIDHKTLETIVKLGWKTFVVSLDSHDEDTADNLRGKGIFGRCVKVLDQLKLLKEEYDSPFPEVEINSVITSRNHDHIPNILLFGADHGAQRIMFIPMTPHNNEMAPLKLGAEHKDSFQESITLGIEIARNLSIETNLESLQDHRVTFKTGTMVPVLAANEFKPVHPATNVSTSRAGRSKNSPLLVKTMKRIFSWKQERKHASSQLLPTDPIRTNRQTTALDATSNKPIMENAFNKENDTISQRLGLLNADGLPLCYEPWSTLVIHPDGSLNPCQHNAKASNIGSRSLNEVWFKDSYLEQMRARHLEKKLPDFCQKCCSAVAAEILTDQRNANVFTSPSTSEGALVN